MSSNKSGDDVALPAQPARPPLGVRVIRWLARLAVLMAAIGLFAFAWPSGPGIPGAVLGLAATALWLALVCCVARCDRGSRAGVRARLCGVIAALGSGAQRAWPAALPLALLPFIARSATFQDPERLVRLALGAALVALGLAEAFVRRTSHPEGDRPSRGEASCEGLRGYRWFSLLFCLCASAQLLAIAAHAEGNLDNDAAYYFGVARHIARSGRFEETIVWHYLVPHASVFHAPFDYWQGLTSLLLVAPMKAFGATSHVALTSMGVIAALGVLSFWYLIAVAAPLRHRVAQTVALLVFVATPSMQVYRFDTESVSVVHLALLATLIAFSHGRLVLAVCLAFSIYLTRGDGSVLCALVWSACLLQSSRDPVNPRRQLLRVLGAMGALIAVYALVCLALYGTPLPPGARLAPALASYADLYRPDAHSSIASLRSRFDPALLGSALWDGWRTLQDVEFIPNQKLWLAFILVLGWRRSRWSLTWLVWLLLFVGSGLVVWLSGVVFAVWRAPYVMLPLVALAAGAGVDRLLDVAAQEVGSRAHRLRRIAYAAACGSALALIADSLTQLHPYAERASAPDVWEHDLRVLVPVLGQATVASMHPWQVFSITDSPSIMIPDDSESGLERLLRHYDVRWLLLSETSCLGRAADTCHAIRAGKKKNIGGLRLKRAQTSGTLALFRVG